MMQKSNLLVARWNVVESWFCRFCRFCRLFIHFIIERQSNCIQIGIDLQCTIHRIGVGDLTVKPFADWWWYLGMGKRPIIILHIMGKENHLTSFEMKKTNYFSENCLKRFLSTEWATECVPITVCSSSFNWIRWMLNGVIHCFGAYKSSILCWMLGAR